MTVGGAQATDSQGMLAATLALPEQVAAAADRAQGLEGLPSIDDVNSVVVRLAVDAPPGRNSCTRPLTLTLSPTATLFGADDVKTKMPSDVASLASGLGSCM